MARDGDKIECRTQTPGKASTRIDSRKFTAVRRAILAVLPATGDGVLFTDLQYHNVGIGMSAAALDVGRFKVTDVETDRGAFKTPTLRDISQSAPYFHDGSAATLADVVAHYNRVRKLGLTAEQQRELVEYLKSL